MRAGTASALLQPPHTQALKHRQHMKRVFALILGLIITHSVMAGPLATSFVNFLVYPNDLDGKEVTVFAYLGPLGERIYMTKDHAEGQDLLSAIQLYHPYQKSSLEVFKECINTYVKVTGLFNKDTERRMAGISKITRIYPADINLKSCGSYE